MPPQHLIIINIMLSMPGATIEAEIQRQINTINIMTAFCPVKSQKQQPIICFLCLGNPNLPQKDWIVKHKTPNSLTRYFLQKHINPPWPARGVECNIYRIELLTQKADLLNHIELYHRTVVQGQTQEKLAQEY
ncbi:hypothetical protein BJX70DRAFT_410354 [Aspergillus crustosus]